jgi:hypothetical protein
VEEDLFVPIFIFGINRWLELGERRRNEGEGRLGIGRRCYLFRMRGAFLYISWGIIRGWAKNPSALDRLPVRQLVKTSSVVVGRAVVFCLFLPLADSEAVELSDKDHEVTPFALPPELY